MKLLTKIAPSSVTIPKNIFTVNNKGTIYEPIQNIILED